MHLPRITPHDWQLALALVMTAFIFVFDILTPGDFIVWLAYLVPLMLLAFSHHRLRLLVVAPLWLALTVTAQWLGPPSIHTKISALNWFMGFLLIIMVSYLLERRRQWEIRLRRISEELAQSNRDLERFAYVASHDLQEPLRTIRSFLKLLEKKSKGKLDETEQEYVRFAVDGAARMQDLISDLLAYSRIAHAEKAWERVHLEVPLRQALHALDQRIQESKAAVTNDPLPSLEADPGQISLLFQNLIGNALKFHRPEVPPRIHVGARAEGETWIISVQDNGIGISREFSAKAFTMFSREHGKHGYPGTGIGLAICKRIVERHGGRIWLESEPGKGTTFHFALPATREETMVEESRVASQMAPAWGSIKTKAK